MKTPKLTPQQEADALDLVDSWDVPLRVARLLVWQNAKFERAGRGVERQEDE